MNETDPFEGVPAPLRAAMEKRGFSQLSPVQSAVLAAASEGRNLRISSQTGSGKTVALGLRLAADLIANGERPAKTGATAGPLALLIAPTRELAVQVAGELRWLFASIPGTEVEVVTGGADLMRERRALTRKPALLVGTPGRLLDHLRTRALSCTSIRHVVLDEADQMLDMGFREELEAILEQLPAERHSHLVSATFPSAVTRLADRFQDQPLHVEGTRLGVANADIQHVAHLIRPRDTERALMNVLLAARGERALVFVRRRIDATELAERLSGDGFCAQPFSGELSQAQRTRTLNAFKNGTIDILISTDVAARGIDIPNISLVVHAAVPEDAEAYTHRSGRTGRAGQKGRSVLLVPAPARRRVERMLESARVTAEWQPVPSADQIQRTLTKQMRRALHSLLDNEAGPSEKQLRYAKLLLEQREPEQLVATLLEMAEPVLPCPPAALSEPTASSTPRPASKPGAYQSFEINWGKRGGATTNRVLSHVCRRGELNSRQIGAIRIEQSRTTFEVSAEAAAAFEKRSRTPDSRDPGLSIRPRNEGTGQSKPRAARHRRAAARQRDRSSNGRGKRAGDKKA